MSFALWDAATGGSIIWGPESHSAVPVTDGLFNVGLGGQTSGGIPTTTWNGDRYLEITVSGETLTPRELIRSVPIAGMALTVLDGSITSNKLILSSGEVCLSDAVTIDLPGGYGTTPIPGLELNFSLDRPSKVLIWMNGLAMFDQDGTSASNVELLVDGANTISSHSYYEDRWDDVKGQRILPLNNGSHQILLQGNSTLPGTMTIHGTGAWKTCAYYLVLGEQ
ncbi:MAG: hypothetical protein GWP17_07005 [Aquificales bacterium]|nr:hypothetical protein [Aquificales bacterium]